MFVFRTVFTLQSKTRSDYIKWETEIGGSSSILAHQAGAPQSLTSLPVPAYSSVSTATVRMVAFKKGGPTHCRDLGSREPRGSALLYACPESFHVTCPGPETGQARSASWEGFSGPDRRQSTQCLLLRFSVLWCNPECGVTLMPAGAVGLVLVHPQSQFQDSSQASTHGLPAGAVFLCAICGATQDQAPNTVLTCWVNMWSVFHRVSSGLCVTRSPSPQAWAHTSPPTLPPPFLRAASGPQHWIAAGAIYAACPSLLFSLPPVDVVRTVLLGQH